MFEPLFGDIYAVSVSTSNNNYLVASCVKTTDDLQNLFVWSVVYGLLIIKPISVTSVGDSPINVYNDCFGLLRAVL